MSDFSTELARWMQARAMGVRELHRRSGYSPAYISQLRHGKRNPSTEAARDLDDALAAGGALVAAILAAGPSRAAVDAAKQPGNAAAGVERFGYELQALWSGVRQSRLLPSHVVDWHLELPPGRVLDGGGRVAVQVRELTRGSDGNSFAPAGDYRFNKFLGTTQRGMLIGIDVRGTTPTLRGLELRHVRTEVAKADPVPSAIAIPPECELDELSYAIIWAVTGIDDALQADDQLLDLRCREFGPYTGLPQSAMPGHAVPELTSTARMWLGSSFCARHILGNLGRPGQVPAFWTREQTGEEACAWLLFRHKYDYLRHVSSQFSNSPDDPLIRGFCIPEIAVLGSPRWERILLFLAIALMESFGVQVRVCADPEYGDVDGFVLVPGSRAIIATWVRAEGIWEADSTSSSSVLRDFAEVGGHLSAHSVTGADTPAGRLRALADYLNLDWAWLTRRSAGLGQGGCGRLAQPRSRLLSLAGVNAALRFTGEVGGDGGV
jgi:transcriptional regulator with XRE-family HTH domain